MLLDILQNNIEINKSNKILFMIRHSEKNKAPKEDPFYDVSLTSKGKDMAKDFGKKLRKITKIDTCYIFTSPLKRCKETSKMIIEGFNPKEYSIEPSRILGDPGAYVIDDELAGKTYLEHSKKGNVEFIKMYLKHKRLPGLRDIKDGTKILLNYIFNSSNKKLSLFITHDVIIASLIVFLTKKIEFINEWIDYLDGIIFCIKKEEIFIYTNQIYELNITNFIKMEL